MKYRLLSMYVNVKHIGRFLYILDLFKTFILDIVFFSWSLLQVARVYFCAPRLIFTCGTVVNRWLLECFYNCFADIRLKELPVELRTKPNNGGLRKPTSWAAIENQAYYRKHENLAQ